VTNQPAYATGVLLEQDTNKTRPLSCAVRFGDKTGLTCGNATIWHCLATTPARQPLCTQNRRSEAVLCCLPFRGEGGPTPSRLPSPHWRGRPTSTTTRTCRVCGCTDFTPCTGPNDYACWWTAPDLCSICQDGA
jgi:hypothetical protein